MHLAVEARLVDDLGAVRLERAAVVVEAHAGHPADQPVGDPRRQAADEAVLAVASPAADDVVALVDLREEAARCPPGRSGGRRPSARSRRRARGRSRPPSPPSARSCAEAGRASAAGRAAARRASRAYVSSSLPSSTTTISYGRPSSSRRVDERAVERLDVVLLVVDGNDDGDRHPTGRVGGGAAAPAATTVGSPSLQYAVRHGRSLPTVGIQMRRGARHAG